MSRYLPDPPEGYKWFAREVGADDGHVASVRLELCSVGSDVGIVHGIVDDFSHLRETAERVLVQFRVVQRRLADNLAILKEVNQ